MRDAKTRGLKCSGLNRSQLWRVTHQIWHAGSTLQGGLEAVGESCLVLDLGV